MHSVPTLYTCCNFLSWLVTCTGCANVGHDSKYYENNERCASCQRNNASYSCFWLNRNSWKTDSACYNLSYFKARKDVASRHLLVFHTWCFIGGSCLLKQSFIFLRQFVRQLGTQTLSLSTDRCIILSSSTVKKKNAAICMLIAGH